MIFKNRFRLIVGWGGEGLNGFGRGFYFYDRLVSLGFVGVTVVWWLGKSAVNGRFTAQFESNVLNRKKKK